jgi:hypothetical protein
MAARHRARFRSIQVRLLFRIGDRTNRMLILLSSVDHPRAGDQDGRGCQAPLYSPTLAAWAALPTATPRHLPQVDICGKPTVDLLSCFLGSAACAGMTRGWGFVLQVELLTTMICTCRLRIKVVCPHHYF